MENTVNTSALHLVHTETALSNANTIFERLVTYVETTCDAVDEVEQAIFSTLLRMGRSLLQHHAAQRAQDEPVREVANSVRVVVPYYDQRGYTYLSIFGDVEISRDYYWKKGAGGGVAPLDEEMSRPARSYSTLLQQWALRLGVVEPFASSVGWLAEQLGVQMPKRSAEELAQEAAQDVDAFYERAGHEVVAPTADECLVVSADGKGVPITKQELVQEPGRLKRGEKAQQKKMAVVATLYRVKCADRSHGLAAGRKLPEVAIEHKQVFAEIKDKRGFVDYLKQRVQERVTEHVKVAYLADGQPDLWRIKQEICPAAVEILDFYHASEYLWSAAYSFLPEGSPEAKAWVEQQEGRFLTGKVGSVIGGLRLRIAKGTIRGEKKIKIAEQAINYFENNRQRMKYDEYLKAGYPIGSGAVEAACKQLVVTRMEGSGMRWSMDGAQAMLKLRTVYINGDWQAYWGFHRQQEHERLYGSRRQGSEHEGMEKKAA
jgi:hypothetical protein